MVFRVYFPRSWLCFRAHFFSSLRFSFKDHSIFPLQLNKHNTAHMPIPSCEHSLGHGYGYFSNPS